MTKCFSCDKPLTQEEIRECHDLCIECDINSHIGRLAFHMNSARMTFEELIRKLIIEVDR